MANFRRYTRRNLKRNYRYKKNFSLSVTLWILIINVLLFLAALVIVYVNPELIKYLALQPTAILQGKYLWTLITSMFAHLAPWHLFANMLTLFFIGSFVERIIGRKRFLWFYLISGLIAAFFFIVLSFLFGNTLIGQRFFGNPEMYALGASGAIFGIAGLITILIPRMRVLVFFVIPMRMWQAMVFFLGFFWILSAFAGLPIGNSAHFGGFLTGLIYGLYLKNKYKRKVYLLRRFFSG